MNRGAYPQHPLPIKMYQEYKMDPVNNLFFKDEFARNYDGAVKKQNWFGAEILFGMIYEYIRPDEKILDAGIGTGLSASLFTQAGLKVYGLDYSNEMLDVCRHKEIAVELIQFDLNHTPLPYQTNFFNHISANAVLYFIPELTRLFAEIRRVLKNHGKWAFIVEESSIGEKSEIIEKPKGRNGLVTYQHSEGYISNLIKNNGFSLLKKIEFVAKNFQMEGRNVPLQLYVAEKME